MKKIMVIIMILIAVAVAAALFLTWGNTAITVTNHEIFLNGLPDEFDGMRVLQVSDFHNTDFGKSITEKIEKAKPDIIVITGDLIDFYDTEMPVSIDFVEKIIKIAPVYYVTGNHEKRIADYHAFREKIEALGVKILDGKTEFLRKNGAEISISGIDDLSCFGSEENDNYASNFAEKLNEISAEKSENASILLSHRPELYDFYADADFDLVFCGHAHGGQIRIPFLGGVLAPSQGFFPKYDSGLFDEKGTKMIVSRGLGNSVFPFRINNRPELILAVLRTVKTAESLEK